MKHDTRLSLTPDQMCALLAQLAGELKDARAALRDPGNVVYRALIQAAWDAPGNRMAGEMRAAAVMLFGEDAVTAALARMKA